MCSCLEVDSVCVEVASVCVEVESVRGKYRVATISRLFKSYVSFAEYRLFYRALLQKRPIIVRSLLIVAYIYAYIYIYIHIYICTYIYIYTYIHICRHHTKSNWTTHNRN